VTASAQAPAGTDVELRLSKGKLLATVTTSSDE
jgi:hypothetical protein